jgi:hypothetical protein
MNYLYEVSNLSKVYGKGENQRTCIKWHIC